MMLSGVNKLATPTINFMLGPREVYLMRAASEKHGNGTVMLPSYKFFNRMGMDFTEVRKHDKAILVLELQRKITSINKSVVVGLDVKHDKICWYAVPDGQKPHTPVPFFENIPEWMTLSYPNPVEEYDNQVWHDIEERFEDAHRVIAGIPLPRKAWYQRASRKK